jgi:hypothetical protein
MNVIATRAVAIRAHLRKGLGVGGKSEEGMGTMSPSAMYALRVANQSESQTKNRRWVVSDTTHSAGFAIGSAQDIGDRVRVFALSFSASGVVHDTR